MHSDATTKRRDRRVSVNGHRGVYYREKAGGGRSYCIGYTDADGRWRWQAVPGGLREADAAISEIRSRLHRGEHVAPTKRSFREVAEEWFEWKSPALRPRTREIYRWGLDQHLYPALGNRRIQRVTETDIAALVAHLRAGGLAEWTIRAILTPLSGTLRYAVRQRMIPTNPMTLLERSERPRQGRKRLRTLSSEEIDRLLASAAARWRVLLQTAIFTGLRSGELLGLRWADVDLDAAVIRVRWQLGRDGERVALKTEAARRDVHLAPSLVKTLAAQRLSSPWSGPDDPVFASATGGVLDRRNMTRRGVEAAAKRAGLTAVSMHVLRHTYASVLIAGGCNVKYAQQQLGHTSASMTLDTYATLWEQAGQAEKATAAMEAQFGLAMR
jgi:integrase